MSIFNSFIRSLEVRPFVATIEQSDRVGSHIQRVVLKLEKQVARPYPVGSYVQPMIGGWVPRAYSIVESSASHFVLLVSFSGLGVGARFFRDAQPGLRLHFYGAFDDFPYVPGTGKDKLFIATGTGVAPFVRMIPESVTDGVRSILLLGVPQEQDIPYRETFEELARQNSLFTFVPVLSRPQPGWQGARGYVTDQINFEDKSVTNYDYYICGVPPMVASAEKLLRQAGVPRSQRYIQKFG